MNTDIRVELTRDLQKMKATSVGANAPWLFALGIFAEVIGGTALLAASIRLTIQAMNEDRLFWAAYSVLLLGVFLIGHSGYLMIKRSFNRKLRSLYEAVLEATATPIGEAVGMSK